VNKHASRYIVLVLYVNYVVIGLPGTTGRVADTAEARADNTTTKYKKAICLTFLYGILLRCVFRLRGYRYHSHKKIATKRQ